jgi:hypothetical protein
MSAFFFQLLPSNKIRIFLSKTLRYKKIIATRKVGTKSLKRQEKYPANLNQIFFPMSNQTVG